jgi:hypothetical protein
MAQRTLAAGFTDTGIEKAAAKSAPAGKKNPRKSAQSAINYFFVPSWQNLCGPTCTFESKKKLFTSSSFADKLL